MRLRTLAAPTRGFPSVRPPAFSLVPFLVLSLVGCLAGSAGARDASTASVQLDAGVVVNAEQVERVTAVLDQFMDALNNLDMEAHSATYHFPHYRHASGQVVLWQSAREAMPILDIPVEERRRALRDALEPDWHRSEWTRRKIVQAGAGKVHVATRFVRLRKDGSVIKTFDSLYVLTIQDGRWGVKGRSSFAP